MMEAPRGARSVREDQAKHGEQRGAWQPKMNAAGALVPLNPFEIQQLQLPKPLRAASYLPVCGM